MLDLFDLNPRGKALGTDLIEWLKDFYRFEKGPESVNDLEPDTKAMYFAGGQYRIREEIFISVDLRIYNDGFVADTRSSTANTDLFLADVLESATKEFSLPYKPESIRKKLYLSELVVRTDKSLAVLNPKLAEFAEQLAAITQTKSLIEFCGIGFWSDADPAKSSFRFERKWGAEFSENRYYSRAPLPTSKHHEMLDKLEELIACPTP
jgi:hypothetical protein